MTFPELYIAYIAWETGGKRRLVLVLSEDDDIISVYPITSQYDKKDKVIQAQYFVINDWGQAGLDKQSYVDTIDIVELSRSAIVTPSPIGKLSEADEARLMEFLTNECIRKV
ncbi:MAG: type II toxin-antitoxin system PemK/MazF family toxin [Clostridiales bacterium]|jgi:hypothetical protein|nr:type II toxin-antitoxin system PemK/MazF family toxin [Clostridiales bacterium]